jgi:hypothetical protein
MGGIGSGRRSQIGTKNTTSDYQPIDVRRWQRAGLLLPNQAFNWQWTFNNKTFASISVRTEPGHIILTYRQRGNDNKWKDESYPVYLDWTKCHLGGQRPWFLCPAKGCGRRVAVLYGGSIFACRKCHQLAYQSQREADNDRGTRRADKIREKLNWEPGILSGKGWKKPKGMHWKTFEKLRQAHDHYVQISLTGMAAKLHLTGESIDDWI